MFSRALDMSVWPLLLWLVHAVRTDSIVTQWPDVVDVTVGNSVTLSCSVMELYSPCSSVAWLRTYPENTTLSKTDTSKVTMHSSSHGWTEVCSAVITSQTVEDSGMYYCVVVQGKFAHIGNGSRVIVKDPTVSPVVEVISPVSYSASVVPLQCLVTGVLQTQVDVYWIIDGQQVVGHSRWTHSENTELIINQLMLSAAEWQSRPACVCVVEYGREVFNKTLQQPGRVFCSCGVCRVVKFLYVALASISVLLTCIIIVTKLASWIRNKQK
ncbi:uncharacterized protein LOC108442976 [Pygocentrus nattereri]|uniref:uncharacterized protein LOC108442976 n=1 Tax=Pygocentrus nattereri TaxID=42514 RepID=UPI0018913BFE|nr:uncharacterized protein LOC108442976 [Pygocentrus nattereri]